MSAIGSLFANDINRKIEEVIKVDQVDADVLRAEIEEYVVTDAIKGHYVDILESYRESSLKRTEGVAIWISGFFGSGKSSFAKNLGLAVENRDIVGSPAAELFAGRIADERLKVVLRTVNEKMPTHAVIFDVSTDRGIRTGNQMLTEIMYGLFLTSLGYAKDLDLAELEIGLEQDGRLTEFEETYRSIYAKGMLAFAIGQASKVLHTMDPGTFPAADSWAKTRARADITPGLFAERVSKLMDRRKPGRSLMFVVDEVGQFVARDVQKMLDLQAIVQQLGVKGRGRHWIAVTSQEKLNELVGGLDDKRIELARLMDRFPVQVHLEPSDISEVTSRRVLAKNAAAQARLGEMYDAHRGRFAQATRLTADIALPELSRERFVDLYPLLPYQVELIIRVVSGLRTQGGASKHVGGANRTIIKLAQQLLINPGTAVAALPVGSLVRLDQVYDLVESNIASEIRTKIASVPARLPGVPMAHAVAKAVCLLHFVKSVHRTAENLAASLHPAVDAPDGTIAVKEALKALEDAQIVRHGEDGYRIPTPAEDDWEQNRTGVALTRAAENKLISDTLATFWTPTPTFNLADAKLFKAGLTVDGKEVARNDLPFHVLVAADVQEADRLSADARVRSQSEKGTVFWVVTLSTDIRREMQEAFRSQEIIARRSRGATTADESTLLVEEKARLRRHTDQLRGYLKAACLAGAVYFRGNDRSPGGTAEVGKAVAEVMRAVLPDVYDRFEAAAAKRADLDKGIAALLTADNLNGLPPVFTALGLLKDENGRVVMDCDKPPLSDVLARIADRSGYGELASGRYLEEAFGQAPYGWDFDAVRLFALALLRAGRIEGLHRSQTVDNAGGVPAKEVFQNNPFFRGATFRPKKGVDFEEIVNAAENYRTTFGREIQDLTDHKVAAEIRSAIEGCEDRVASVVATLRGSSLPGREAMEAAADLMKAVRRGTNERTILDFNSGHADLKEAVRKAGEVEKLVGPAEVAKIAAARDVIRWRWPVLQEEQDLSDATRADGALLLDLLERETFYREIAQIAIVSGRIGAEYDRRYKQALERRVSAYQDALDRLARRPEWAELSDAQQDAVTERLRRGADPTQNNQTLQHLRSETEACEGRLGAAAARMHELLEGDRLATLRISEFFQDGIETVEQLDQTLDVIRDEVSRLIGAGKKVMATWGA
jgi:hypothetical protein